MTAASWYIRHGVDPLTLSRLCADCQVSSLALTCWLCGADVSKGTHVSVPSAGPRLSAVGTSLIL